MDVLSAELAEYLEAFGIGQVAPTTSGLGQAGPPLQALVAQKGLNRLTRCALREDGIWGPRTAACFNAWTMTLPPEARRRITAIPSVDKRWVTISPEVVRETLDVASRRPRRTAAAPAANGRVSVAAMGRELQASYLKSADFARRIEETARQNQGRVPGDIFQAWVRWYESTLALQALLVQKLRADQALAQAIARHEAGRTSAAAVAQTLTQERPARPSVPGTPLPVRTELGNGITAGLVALGIVIAAGAAIYLTTAEIASTSENRTSRERLEAVLQARREGIVRPEEVPALPGGPEERERETERERAAAEREETNWVPWVVGGLLGLGALGVVFLAMRRDREGGTQVFVERGERRLPPPPRPRALPAETED